MTNKPSRDELEHAIHNYGNAVSDDIEPTWDLIQSLLDRLYFIDLLMDAGDILTINDIRTKILGWPPLPPDDHRGNSLLRRGP